jgi:hypothetical protein
LNSFIFFRQQFLTQSYFYLSTISKFQKVLIMNKSPWQLCINIRTIVSLGEQFPQGWLFETRERNVFQGGKTNSPPLLMMTYDALISRTSERRSARAHPPKHKQKGAARLLLLFAAALLFVINSAFLPFHVNYEIQRAFWKKGSRSARYKIKKGWEKSGFIAARAGCGAESELGAPSEREKSKSGAQREGKGGFAGSSEGVKREQRGGVSIFPSGPAH